MPKKKREYPEWAITKGRRSRWEKEERRKRIVTRVISAAIVVVLVLVAIVVIDSIADDDNDNVTVLKVNDHSIKMDYFVEALRYYGISQASDYESSARQVLSRIQGQELLNQLARSRGISVTEQEIDHKIDEVYDLSTNMGMGESGDTPSLSYDTLIKRVKSNGISESFFREQNRLDLLAEKMIDVIGAEEVPAEMPQANIRAILINTTIEEPAIEAVEPSEEESIGETEAQANKTESSETTEADTTEDQPAEESITEGKQDPEATRAVIQARLSGGEDFAALAEAFSQDAGSRLKGGDLGWLADEYISLYYGDTFKEVAFDVDLETLSDPIPTSTSSANTYYWLIEVLEREESRALGEDQKNILYSRAFSDWFEEETSNQPALSIKDKTLEEAITKALNLG